MKRLHTILLVAAGCLAITSCSDDDDNNYVPQSNVNDNLEGSYQLTSANAPSAQDYDNDGDSSANLVLEGSCYNNSWISFHSDGTYDQSYSSSTTGAGGLSLDCDTQLTTGTYEQNGNTITTHMNGQAAVTSTFTYDTQSHTLTQNNANGAYSAWNATSSLWATLTGSMQLTYVKYTDNGDDNGASADTDGPNDDENNANFNLLGDFGLTSMIVADAQNLDNDGDSSTNLLTESNCYMGSNIVLHEDGTYEEHHTWSALGSLGLSLDCQSETTFGTWTREGDTVTAHRTSSGTGSVDTDFTFDANTNMLTRTDNNGQYVSFNSVTSLYAMLTGAVNYTYTHE
jgi:hypothetical protein